MATASVTNTLANGTTVDAPDLNTNFNDLVNFLNASVIHTDGTKSMAAALALGSNKITGLADGTALTDAATFKQADHFVLTFTQAGDLAVGTGKKVPLPFACDIIEVVAYAETAPTGAALIVDVNVDGTTIFTTQSNRPQIAVSTNLDRAATIEDASHTADQLLSVDIDQIGSTVAGADLKVHVHLRRT